MSRTIGRIIAGIVLSPVLICLGVGALLFGGINFVITGRWDL